MNEIEHLRAENAALRDRLVRIRAYADHTYHCGAKLNGPCDCGFVDAAIDSCPRCGALMVKRTNRTTRKEFWGCSRFPECTRTSRAPRAPADYPPLDYDPDFDLYPDPYDLGYDGDG